MTVNYALAAGAAASAFKNTANKDDVTRFSIDATGWAEDSGAVISAASSIDYGSVSVTNETLVAGVWSADVTMLSRGETKLDVLISTATQKKKASIYIQINDSTCGDDYGQGCC